MEAEEFMELFDSCWFGTKTEEIPTTAMLMLHKNDNKLRLHSSSERCIRVDVKAPDTIIPEKGENSSVNKRRVIRKGLIRRSLSALEIEEVKGFMDLGFVFNENNPALVSIIPGLGKMDCYDDDEVNFKCRPYRVLYEREKKANLKNWKMPASTKNEVNMKDHLRFWAHIVASNVK